MTAQTEDLIALEKWLTMQGERHRPNADKFTEAAQALRSLQQEVERLRGLAKAADGRAADYRTVAINQGWNWNLCDQYGREAYAKHRGEHVDACALNASEARARSALIGSAQG